MKYSNNKTNTKFSITKAIGKGSKNKNHKTSDFVWTGGGGGWGPRIIPCVWIHFYPRSPPRGEWVNRWTFSPSPSSPSSSSPSSSRFQIFVSLRYWKCQFSKWFDFPGNSSDSYLFLLLLLLFPGAFLSGELSTPVWRTVHRLQAVQWLLFLQPWGGYKTGSQIKASPGLNIKLAHYYCLRKTDSTVNTVRVPEQYCKQ